MQKNKKGFSLIELIVAVTLLAIATTVLAPSLLHYVEDTRAKKDDAAMQNICLAIENALATDMAMNEFLIYTEEDNVSCYIDSDLEEAYERDVFIQNDDGSIVQYTFGDEARVLDEKAYNLAGNMRGVTITLTPKYESGKKTKFTLSEGAVNKYFNDPAAQTELGSMVHVYNEIIATVEESIKATSQTYRNSEYTIFIRMNTGGQLIETSHGNTIEVYGQWGGTNLAAGSSIHNVVTDRIVGNSSTEIPDGTFDSAGNRPWNELDDIYLPPPPTQGGGYDENGNEIPETYTQYRIDYYQGEHIGVTPATGNPSQYDVTTPTFTLYNPTRTGYDFLGWTGSNGETPQTTITVETGSYGNKTYYCNEERHWKVITYPITYNMDGGSNNPANPTTYTIADGTITLGQPTKTGAVFLGWTGSNGSTPQKSVSIPSGSTDPKTYTANWQWQVYEIAYNMNDSNDGDGLDNPASHTNPTTYTFTTPTFKLKQPTKRGWTFTGWSNGDSATTELEPQISQGTVGNKAYKANWVINEYYININYVLNGTLYGYDHMANIGTVDLYVNGRLIQNDLSDYYKPWPHGTKYALMDIKPKPGYKCIDNLSHSGTVDGETVSLNIEWETIEYTVTFNANGGTCSETERKIKYEETYQGKDNGDGTYKYGVFPTPTRSGYTFKGWFTADSGGTQVLVTDLIPPSNVTLHAQWTAN